MTQNRYENSYYFVNPQIKLKNIPPQNLKLTATFDTMEISDILYIINQTLDTNLTITIQQ